MSSAKKKKARSKKKRVETPKTAHPLLEQRGGIMMQSKGPSMNARAVKPLLRKNTGRKR